MTGEELRPFVVPLAVLGAALVLAASVLQWKTGREARFAVLLTRLGYGLTFLSITLFIVIGFLPKD